MTFNEYLKTIEINFPKILDENLLFWNLWNTSFAFDILEKYKEEYLEYYKAINNMWELCWEFNDTKKINLTKFHEVFDNYYPFIINEDGEIENPKGILQRKYEELNDEYLAEASIIQLIYRFNVIYDGLTKNMRYGKQARTTPIEIISVILQSNNIDEDGMELPIMKNEIEAQIKLVKDLSKPQNYTYKDRNIYRDREAMESVKFNDGY